ncbi:hypothetical protein [Luteimonas mephitis]|uniref:hypothetical protein n=1 Tax=Luteimonas mephitis TaxID=83615 RepID=UPI003A95B495
MNIQMIPLAGASSLIANAVGAAVDVRECNGWCQIALCALVESAVDMALTVRIQHSADGVTGWTDVVAFERVEGAEPSQQVLNFNADGFRGFVRVVDTLEGTNPAAVRTVTLFAKANIYA